LYWPALPLARQLQPVRSELMESSAAGKPHSRERESEYSPQKTVG
jgi:hypothetical protein